MVRRICVLTFAVSLMLVVMPAHAHAEVISIVTTALISLLSAAPIALTAPLIATIGITSAAQILAVVLVAGAPTGECVILRAEDGGDPCPR